MGNAIYGKNLSCYETIENCQFFYLLNFPKFSLQVQANAESTSVYLLTNVTVTPT